MDKENFAKMLAEKYWPTLVVKHTVGGACNFQRAANELAELVSVAEREACATWYDEKGWLLDEDDVADAMRKRDAL